MRLFVLFDLPTKTEQDRKNYTTFRNHLLKNGYHMFQYSVYYRICNHEDAVDTHLKKLISFLPPRGCVRFLQITDKQYSKMKILVGTPTKQEKTVSNQQLLLF